MTLCSSLTQKKRSRDYRTQTDPLEHERRGRRRKGGWQQRHSDRICLKESRLDHQNSRQNADKGEINTEEKDSIIDRIETIAYLKDSAAADFVVVAATENETFKFQMFVDWNPEILLLEDHNHIKRKFEIY